jgi:AcrR family transcriptional regulator
MKTTKRRYNMTARAAKAEANAERIRTVAMTLYNEQPIEKFTLDEIAAGAGTTVQTILRIFGSKEDLLLAALSEMVADGVALKVTPPGDIPAAVAAIIDVYETVGDVVIQRLNDERRYPALKTILDQGRQNHRNWVKTAFAPSIARQEGGQRALMLNALVAATDVYVWKLLRRDRGVGRAAAEAVVRRLVEGITHQQMSEDSHSVAELVGRREPAG